MLRIIVAGALLACALAKLGKNRTDFVDLCQVSPLVCGVESYSGQVDVGEAGFLFYWYFPAKARYHSKSSGPLTLWLQGGPGASSMQGLFFENGPLCMREGGVPELRPAAETWISHPAHLSMLFVDSPVGTGWSQARSNTSFSKNEADVTGNLIILLREFGKRHPEAPKTLLIAGESYGGHYLPALGAHIVKNPSSIPFKLWGLSLGNSFLDAPRQVLEKPRTAFFFGLIDEDQMGQAKKFAEESSRLAHIGRFNDSLAQRAQLESYVFNATGGINFYDVRTSVPYTWMDMRLSAAFNRPLSPLNALRLNLPNGTLFKTDPEVKIYLMADEMRSQKHHVEVMLKAGIEVMLYQGQWDWKDGVVENEAWIRSMDWDGVPGYLDAKRSVWRRASDDQVAGWWRQHRNLHQAVVRNAGHMATHNQPASAIDLISRFVWNNPPPPPSALDGFFTQPAPAPLPEVRRDERLHMLFS